MTFQRPYPNGVVIEISSQMGGVTRYTATVPYKTNPRDRYCVGSFDTDGWKSVPYGVTPAGGTVDGHRRVFENLNEWKRALKELVF
jgi:hypothetical protein